MNRMSLEQARSLLAYVDRGGASRLGIIQEGGGNTVLELQSIRQAQAVVARHEASEKKTP